MIDPAATPDALPDRLATLDILRGLAALGVCLGHFAIGVLGGVKYEAAIPLLSLGFYGVPIFFVISGFVLPLSLERGGYTLRGAPIFLARRLTRIGPPAWITIIGSVALFFLLDRVKGGAPFWSADLSPARLAHNLAFTIPFTSQSWINGVLWTLSVELQYYLFLALVFPLAFRSGRTMALTALLLWCAYYLPVPKAQTFLLHNLAFLIGGLVFMFRAGRVGRVELYAGLAALTLAAGWRIGVGEAAASLVAALVILHADLRFRVGAFLGRISYSLYLIHWMTGLVLANVIIRFVPPTGAAARLFLYLACLAGTLIAAWVFYRVVERPSLVLAKRIGGRSRGRAQTADPPL